MAESGKGGDKPGAAKSAGGSMRIDPSLVRELAELLTANDLNEIEVEDGDRKIKVRRDPPQLASAQAPLAHAAQPLAPALSAPPMHGKEDLADEEEEVAGEAVKSPMVGTAYLSPEPGTKPFVNVGDAVKAGDTLLIVEAMKVMNPITAPHGGVVKKILISDGQPVEFDQPLVLLG
jgi:acetyl-CoA carboxylase biotin carboxyl carrier protein